MKNNVPLLLGSGKLYRHLIHLLETEGRAFLAFPSPRALDDSFYRKLEQADWTWLLVADSAIAPLSAEIRRRAPAARLVHASGALSVAGVLTAHPLFTFGPELYPDLATYRDFPFTFIEEELADAPDFLPAFSRLFPNPVIRMPAASRALYHALASVTANFPQLLWAWCAEEAGRSGLDYRAYGPLLRQAAANFAGQGAAALTGPLVRGDRATIERQEAALEGSALLPLFHEFVRQFQQRKDSR